MSRILLALLLATPAAAQAPLPDAAAVEMALDSHPSVVAAQARGLAARADARAMAAGPHEFVASASLYQRRVEGEGRYAEYDASLTRAIRLPGKAALDRRAGAAAVRHADNMAEDARHQAAVMLNDHWWDWVGAAGEQAVLARSVVTHAEMAKAINRRVALRDAAILEAESAAAALAQAQAAARLAAGREAAARASLTAQFPGLPLPAKAPTPPPPQLPSDGLAALAPLVIARSHEIEAAEARAEQAALLAARARRDRFADPSVGIRGFSERSGAERGLGLMVSVPLGGVHRRALAERARATATAAEAERLAVQQDIEALAGRDLALAEAGFAGWQGAQAAAGASASAAGRAARGHALGGLDIADRLYAERLAQEAALAETIARAEAWRAITRLQIDSHMLWMHPD